VPLAPFRLRLMKLNVVERSGAASAKPRWCATVRLLTYVRSVTEVSFNSFSLRAGCRSIRRFASPFARKPVSLRCRRWGGDQTEQKRKGPATRTGPFRGCSVDMGTTVGWIVAQDEANR
jgi:hypothetical protein